MGIVNFVATSAIAGLNLGLLAFVLAFSVPANAQTPDELVERGRELYEAGQFASAAQVWENAASTSATQGDRLQQAIALSNLSVALQELGEWDEAKRAIAQSLELIETQRTNSSPWWRVQAQALNTQGAMEFALGQAEAAASTWAEAADAYQKAGDLGGMYRAAIEQARSLQALGLYRRSLSTLQQLQETLKQESDSLTKAAALRSLGNALRLVGDIEESERVLQESLAIATRVGSPQAIGETLIALGNSAIAQQNPEAAREFYQRAATTAPASATAVQAQLNALSLLADRAIEARPEDNIAVWVPQILAQIDRLPPSRIAVYARIKLAQSLIKLERNGESSSFQALDIAELLATSVQQARSIDDAQAESYALGNLGGLYERDRQWKEAQQLTEQALQIAQQMNANDIAYRWEWQLGRLFVAQGDTEGAIAVYTQALKSLDSLRLDLVTTNREVQFSFRDSVEPVYRELVALLLQQSNPNQKVSQENLEKALSAIEALKLAELDNFFRDACVDAQPVEIDKQQIDPTAAIFYPIVLDDRLEVIVSLPDRPLRHYSTPLPKAEIEQTLIELRQRLVTRTSRRYLDPAAKVYDWLIAPIETDLAESGVQTLIVVPDGLFRNVPIAALYDGKKFLLEKYSIAVSPGLKLTDPQPLRRQNLQALTAGLTEGRFGFSQLPNVAIEVEQVNHVLSGTILLDEQFTSQTLQQALLQSSFPIVHIATHGQFSSRAEDTFILAWDERINVNELDNLLRVRNRTRNDRALELLVLSACQTATGDDRAALGLAGVAVRAGARSTLATLWYIDDAATVPLMVEFYDALNQSKATTKAEALRQAQLALLQQPEYRHPIYWAPYVLIGNWL